MLIDWFTVGAQVVNFLVLVVVLKFVLFDRIVAAMDQRERGIAERIHLAEEREAEAAREADVHRATQRELEAQRARRLAQADADATARRSELLEAARTHVDGLRAGWETALRRERAHFLEEVRRRTGEQVCTISRRALSDLADAELEAQLVRVAVRRLEEDTGRLQPLVDESRDGAVPVTVRSTFELSGPLADEVVAAVTARLGCDRRDVVLLRDPGLVCGIEIRAGGWSVGWSVDGYLDAVADELDSLLPETGDDECPTAGSGP